MKKFLMRSWHEQKGQDSAEYALMFILVTLVVVAVLQIMDAALHKNYASASSTMASIAGHRSSSNSDAAGQPASGNSSGSADQPDPGGAGESGGGSAANHGHGSGHGHGHGEGGGHGSGNGHGSGVGNGSGGGNGGTHDGHDNNGNGKVHKDH